MPRTHADGQLRRPDAVYTLEDTVVRKGLHVTIDRTASLSSSSTAWSDALPSGRKAKS